MLHKRSCDELYTPPRKDTRLQISRTYLVSEPQHWPVGVQRHPRLVLTPSERCFSLPCSSSLSLAAPGRLSISPFNQQTCLQLLRQRSRQIRLTCRLFNRHSRGVERPQKLLEMITQTAHLVQCWKDGAYTWSCSGVYTRSFVLVGDC